MPPAIRTPFAGICSAVADRYRRIFSLREIEESLVLQLVFGATLFSYFIAFFQWTGSHATTIDAYLDGTLRCRPYFQGCGDFLFLHALPEGYSQAILYMVLMELLFCAAYFGATKRWTLAHIALVPAFLWHTAVVFFLTDSIGGNYDYYLFLFALVLLFVPHKEYFLKIIFVFSYVLASTIKIHEGWVLGTYFSSLKTGLPIFPKWSIPLLTNSVIFMQMVGSWFLLSRKSFWQRATVLYFLVFHFYSGFIVEYRYPATVAPTLFFLFGPLYRWTPSPFDRKSIAGWFLVIGMFCAQMIPVTIPGDVKLTLEGNRYGFYMFEANHQCISRVEMIYADGTTRRLVRYGASARDRCDPYRSWFHYKWLCTNEGSRITRIAWTFDHSINGGAFVRIVDVPDICALEYRPFSHNAWIRTEKDSPPIIGWPVENLYY